MLLAITDEKRGDKVQKWEYLFLYVQFAVDNGVYHVHWLNGEKVRDWKRAPTPEAFLTQYGTEGWELVSRNGIELVFKRPI